MAILMVSFSYFLKGPILDLVISSLFSTYCKVSADGDLADDLVEISEISDPESSFSIAEKEDKDIFQSSLKNKLFIFS